MKINIEKCQEYMYEMMQGYSLTGNLISNQFTSESRTYVLNQSNASQSNEQLSPIFNSQTLSNNFNSIAELREQKLESSLILQPNGNIIESENKIGIVDNQKKLYDDFCAVNGIGNTLKRQQSLEFEDILHFNGFKIQPNKQRIIPTIQEILLLLTKFLDYFIQNMIIPQSKFLTFLWKFFTMKEDCLQRKDHMKALNRLIFKLYNMIDQKVYIEYATNSYKIFTSYIYQFLDIKYYQQEILLLETSGLFNTAFMNQLTGYSLEYSKACQIEKIAQKNLIVCTPLCAALQTKFLKLSGLGISPISSEEAINMFTDSHEKNQVKGIEKRGKNLKTNESEVKLLSLLIHEHKAMHKAQKAASGPIYFHQQTYLVNDEKKKMERQKVGKNIHKYGYSQQKLDTLKEQRERLGYTDDRQLQISQYIVDNQYQTSQENEVKNGKSIIINDNFVDHDKLKQTKDLLQISSFNNQEAVYLPDQKQADTDIIDKHRRLLYKEQYNDVHWSDIKCLRNKLVNKIKVQRRLQQYKDQFESTEAEVDKMLQNCHGQDIKTEKDVYKYINHVTQQPTGYKQSFRTHKINDKILDSIQNEIEMIEKQYDKEMLSRKPSKSLSIQNYINKRSESLPQKRNVRKGREITKPDSQQNVLSFFPLRYNELQKQSAQEMLQTELVGKKPPKRNLRQFKTTQQNNNINLQKQSFKSSKYQSKTNSLAASPEGKKILLHNELNEEYLKRLQILAGNNKVADQKEALQATSIEARTQLLGTENDNEEGNKISMLSTQPTVTQLLSDIQHTRMAPIHMMETMQLNNFIGNLNSDDTESPVQEDTDLKELDFDDFTTNNEQIKPTMVYAPPIRIEPELPFPEVVNHEQYLQDQEDAEVAKIVFSLQKSGTSINLVQEESLLAQQLQAIKEQNQRRRIQQKKKPSAVANIIRHEVATGYHYFRFQRAAQLVSIE